MSDADTLLIIAYELFEEKEHQVFVIFFSFLYQSALFSQASPTLYLIRSEKYCHMGHNRWPMTSLKLIGHSQPQQPPSFFSFLFLSLQACNLLNASAAVVFFK